MRINHNIQALNAYSKLTKNQLATGKALEKLSSGLRINRAADDAAGLAISEKMRGQIRGLGQAERNAQDGISLIQTAEGALGEVHDMLSRMRELAVQAANGTLTESDRGVIQDEINQLRQQVDRVGNDTQFNTKKLLNGSLSENASIRSLYGTVSYSKTGAGLRDINIDEASVLPQDVYSLNVVTSSKVVQTKQTNGTDDPYKTGMENILLSPDSLLGKGEYKIALKAKPQFASAKYTNASELNANDPNFPKGNYLVEYDAKSKVASLFELDKNGVKVGGAKDTQTVIVPDAPNDTKPINVTFSGTGGTTSSFKLMNPTQNAKVEFEKSIDTTSPMSALPLDGNVAELDTTGSVAANLADGKYKIAYDGLGVAKLYKSSDPTNPIATKSGIDTTGAETIDFGNNTGIVFKLKDASQATQIEFEKFGAYPGKVLSSIQNLSEPTYPSSIAPGNYKIEYTGSVTGSQLPGGATSVGDITSDGISIGVEVGKVFTDGPHILTMTVDDPADFAPSVASVTYSPALNPASLSKGVFAGDEISATATAVAANDWTLTKTATGEYNLKSVITNVNDTFAGPSYTGHGLSFTIDNTKFAAANVTSIGFVTAGGLESINTAGEGYDANNTGGNDAIFDTTITTSGKAIEISSDAYSANWTITWDAANSKFKVDNDLTGDGEVHDEIAPGGLYDSHGLKFNITSAGTMAQNDKIAFSTAATGTISLDGGTAQPFSTGLTNDTTVLSGLKVTTGAALKQGTFTFSTEPSTGQGEAILKNEAGQEINRIQYTSSSNPGWSAGAINVEFNNGVKTTVTEGKMNATADFTVDKPPVSMDAAQLGNSTLQDGSYMIESDGVSAWLYEVDENGQKVSPQPIDKIEKVGSGEKTFEHKKVSFTGQVGKIIFKQTTEYEMDIYKGDQDINAPGVQSLAGRTGIHFGEEAIDLRNPDGKSVGITIDFTNAANGYVKRGGALPEEPAKGLPFYGFSVNDLNRTSVILKDSTDKVIAHQFVDNDRKFVELGNTGISFSTGVLSHNEKAINIDIRQNLENASVNFQIGTNAGEIVELGIGDIRCKELGIDKFKLTDETSASNAIATIDDAIDKVSAVRSKLGAYQNRMEHTVNNITQANENLTAAESRIRDADMAKEMTEFTKLNIINQSATAMLAQANQLPQGVLQLLKG